MLYQPTNVYPSMAGGMGNGVVDANADLTVSWQVNGNTAMDSFSIAIYKNNTASTLMYSTGNLTQGCPFSGVSSTGKARLFSYTISSSTLLSAGIKNGNEYKMVISQASGSDTVTQTAASVFLTRETPKISLIPFPEELIFTRYTFELDYPSSNVPINWIRWVIEHIDQDGNVDDPALYDTGNIFGTTELKCEYDGFLTGNRYAIRCDIETVYGTQVSTGRTEFSVKYDLIDFSENLTTQKICGHTGIKLSWSQVSYIPGTAIGEYSISDGIAKLKNSTTIFWDKTNTSQMNFISPWSFLFRGKLINDTGSIDIQLASGNINMYVEDWNFIINLPGVTYNYKLSSGSYVSQVVITPYGVYIEAETALNGLYPSRSLYPAPTRYPKTPMYSASIRTVLSGDTNQRAIKKISANGSIDIDYIAVLRKGLSASEVTNILLNRKYEPKLYDDNLTVFAATFDEGIGAGNIAQTESAITKYSLYRKDGSESILRHIADVSMSETSFYDLSVVSQLSYKYYLYPSSDDRMEISPLTSKSVSICFWSWNILSCTENSDGEYIVQREYCFGKNLSSGAIGNNNTPNILNNFTPYPLVQMSSTNYKSGTLKSLIGTINNLGEYSDSIGLRESIYALATTRNTLFLKDPKGDILLIRISGAVSMETMDGTPQQAQTATIPWVEIGDAASATLTIATPDNYIKDSDNHNILDSAGEPLEADASIIKGG